MLRDRCIDGIKQLIGHYTKYLYLGHTADRERVYFLKDGEFYIKKPKDNIEIVSPDPVILFWAYDEKTLIETARTIEEALKSLTPSG